MFNFKAVTRLLSMGEYAPEYAGADFQVWVNMPRAVVGEFYQLQDDVALANKATGDSRKNLLTVVNKRLFDWLSKVLSQSEDQTTHVTPDEVEQMALHLIDTDPQAWPWLISRVQEVIADYRTAARKN